MVRVMVQSLSEPSLRLLGIWGEPVRREPTRRYYPVPDVDEVNAAADFDLFHQDAWDLTVNRIVISRTPSPGRYSRLTTTAIPRAWEEIRGRKVRRRPGRDQLRRLRADHNASGDRRR